MTQLKIFKNQFIRTLSADVVANIKSYRSGNFDWTLAPENKSNYFILDAPWFNKDALTALNNVSAGKRDDVDDARDAKLLYGAMKNMSPSLARDPRIWATLTHTCCITYIRQRNWKFINARDVDVASNNIKNRFFIENTRAFERTNALARLWWFGYIAETTNLNFNETMDALLTYTDFRASTIERPEVFVHREIRAAVLDLAISRRKKNDDFSKDRERYRPLFKDITERAARVFFPTMDHVSVLKLVEQNLPKPKAKTRGNGR